jgi:hypothetical protein
MSRDAVADLARRVWDWKHETAFRSADDIPRIAHDPLWLPAFDADAVAARLERFTGFDAEWRALDVSGEPVPVQVDHRLVGSALARVRWDLDVVRSWQTDANFLVSQILGPYFDLLLPLPPFSPERQEGLVAALAAVPRQAAVARDNLEHTGVADLAALAAQSLDGIRERLAASVGALRPVVSAEVFARLEPVGAAAGEELERFRRWLEQRVDGFAPAVPVGRDRFVWYLRNVALIPDDPEQLVAAAEQEYRRAVVWEAVARTRVAEEPPFFATAAEQMARQRDDEQSVRDVYEQRGLVSQAGYAHYFVAPVPDYVAPLSWLTVNDDLTDAGRPDTDGVSYFPEPGAGLPYFYAANARDPRLGIAHEGTHYQQLVRAWKHDDPVRREYYDSVANEGIAFYNEELMLQAGLFDDSAHSRAVVQNFMRLRSLRVIVDVSLATGAYSLAEGIAAFVDRVPMDAATAREETALYVATPGLAMSYLVGKLQLMAMLADYLAAGDGATDELRTFHDWVWLNGNLPFSLQRWELLGDRSAVDALDATPLAP